ncbi:hypothetical protein F2Q70_00009032 [Brassica cretica]|uniref:Uncharacterized protein n=1 Tax=Brassica cretica TaxID=69181 RepID=A0A8S9J5L0_BRACR|nr:hypothetical protein F2Q68_00002099 [Brassica cretica]KAF2612899.1 hypothetical protein F2Q70_00009032 [Brassica cretica]
MEAGVRAGASPSRNMNAGVLPDAWRIFIPEYFSPHSHCGSRTTRFGYRKESGALSSEAT